MFNTSGSRLGFFSNGVTTASFISSGKTPCQRGRFTSLVIGSTRIFENFFSRKVGMGSRGDDFVGLLANRDNTLLGMGQTQQKCTKSSVAPDPKLVQRIQGSI